MCESTGEAAGKGVRQQTERAVIAGNILTAHGVGHAGEGNRISLLVDAAHAEVHRVVAHGEAGRSRVPPAASGIADPLAAARFEQADGIVLTKRIKLKDGSVVGSTRHGRAIKRAVRDEIAVALLELDLLCAGGVVQLIGSLTGDSHDAAERSQAHVVARINGACIGGRKERLGEFARQDHVVAGRQRQNAVVLQQDSGLFAHGKRDRLMILVGIVIDGGAGDDVRERIVLDIAVFVAEASVIPRIFPVVHS